MDSYICWIQERLSEKGFDPGPIDGMMGQRTLAAIVAFQRANHLLADGLVGEETHGALAKMTGPILNGSPLKLKNFTDHEFACRCGCGLDVVDSLKIFAQELRDYFDWPLAISSGGRCPVVNKEDGGVPDSLHLSGQAFDAFFPGRMNEGLLTEMADFAVDYGIGVIRYPGRLFAHFQTVPRNSVMV